MCAIFVASAFDHRLGWSAVPLPLVVAGHVAVAAGYLAMLAVFRENSFASSTIEVGAGQRVISTGPYALVRHPLYAAALAMFLGVLPALGSWWGLLPAGLLAAAVVARLKDEEAYLARDLPGFEAYCSSVRWRLVPGVW